MKRFLRGRGSVAMVAFASLLVLVLLLVLLLIRQSGESSTGIVLPDASVADQSPQQSVHLPNGSFAELSPENVIDVLKTITSYKSYHQSYIISYGSGEWMSSRYLEEWVSDDLLHAELFDGIRTKSVLTNGTAFYVWYNNDDAPVYLPQTPDVSAEDVLGIKTYTDLMQTHSDQIVDASFLTIEEGKPISCIYVESVDQDEYTSRYWIDIRNGLLFRAEVWYQEECIYSLKRQNLSLLGDGDSVFEKKFSLPDGTRPFTA